MLVAVLLAAAPVEAGPPRVPGLSKLSSGQREIARAAIKRIACYHGCKDRIDRCLEARPRCKTAWRVARYIVFLASKKLTADQIADVVDLRRRSVVPAKRHAIAPGLAPRLGDAKAPLTIVEYADFRCGHCAVVSPALERLVKAFRGKVSLVFKVYPLRFKGPHLVAARAALAAHRQGKFWPMANLLFKNHDQHTAAGVERLARKARLDLDRFRAAMKDVNLLKQLESNKIEGMRLGLKGTPTLYFNGKPHLLRKDAFHLRDRIEEELELLGKL
jgi:protein-disulfide isomerase